MADGPAAPTGALGEILFRPYGFRPVGPGSHLIEPARCACGITAQYSWPRFGLLCAPCYQGRKAECDA